MRCSFSQHYRSLAAWAGLFILGAGLAGVGGLGCAGTASNPPEPSDTALKDPMNYSPNIPNTDMSGTGTMDTKSFDKDMNDLLNP